MILCMYLPLHPQGAVMIGSRSSFINMLINDMVEGANGTLINL